MKYKLGQVLKILLEDELVVVTGRIHPGYYVLVRVVRLKSISYHKKYIDDLKYAELASDLAQILYGDSHGT